MTRVAVGKKQKQVGKASCCVCHFSLRAPPPRNNPQESHSAHTMTALSSRICFASVPMVASRSRTMDESRGDLKVYAGKKKSKRSQERKAQRKAENKELMSSGKKSGEEEEDVGEASVKGPAPYESTASVMQSLTICGSYKSQTGEKLLDGKGNPVQPAVPNPILRKQVCL